VAAATPFERIQSARKAVQCAFDAWDAANLDQIHACRSLLDDSVADLSAAADSVSAGPERLPAEARPVLADLKRNVTMMLRVVDACAAFQRGLALQRGQADPNYNASGLTGAEERSGPEVTLDV
jgi:hypothetical protein